jgi:hypothetical protein
MTVPEQVTTPDGRSVMVLHAPAVRFTASGMTDELGAAEYLGCSTRNMQRMRQQRRGPKYIVTTQIWYSRPDLDEYLTDMKVDPLASKIRSPRLANRRQSPPSGRR